MRYLFGWKRTGLVHLLTVTAMLLTYLMVRVHDMVGTSVVYLIAGVLGVVAAFRRPRFVVPPHLRDYEEE